MTTPNAEYTAVLIPSFNAGGSLPALFGDLFRYVKPRQVIVVDDGSRDNTARVAASAGVTLLRHAQNCGKGAALRTGFEFIRGVEVFDSVMTMDADLQHRAGDIPSFLEVRRLRNANIVIGHRRRWGTRMPVPRMLSNSVTSFLVTARTGAIIKDSQCGYRLIGREVIDSLSLEADGYEAETELLIKAAHRGFRIEFVPIDTVYADERSHMTHWHTMLQFIQVLMKDY